MIDRNNLNDKQLKELLGGLFSSDQAQRAFDEIKAGTKPEEFRDPEIWQHKLDTKNYTDIRLYRGFEKVGPGTIIDLPYKGYKLKTITHPHFDNVPTLVCAIDVRG